MIYSRVTIHNIGTAYMNPDKYANNLSIVAFSPSCQIVLLSGHGLLYHWTLCLFTGGSENTTEWVKFVVMSPTGLYSTRVYSTHALYVIISCLFVFPLSRVQPFCLKTQLLWTCTPAHYSKNYSASTSSTHLYPHHSHHSATKGKIWHSVSMTNCLLNSDLCSTVTSCTTSR